MSLAFQNSLRRAASVADDASRPEVARLRIGVIGARTRRQGIGEHVARHFAALGHHVTAIAGSSLETAAEARSHLQQAYGIAARAYASVDALLKSEMLDAVAICSPDRFHRQHLQAAISHDVHVLCEKPLVFDAGREPAADAAALLAGSQAANKLLVVNEQWPYTLQTFDLLYPEARVFERVPRRISMRLSPSVAGFSMIPNAAPHLLSLVSRLCPAGGALGPVEIASPGPTHAALDIRFSYQHAAGTTHVSLELRQSPEQPRAAAYAIDGRGARRIVEMSPYRFLLEAAHEGDWQTRPSAFDARRVAMPDPLALLVADFVQRIEQCQAGEACWRDATLLDRLRALGKIAEAAEQTFASCGDAGTDELT